MLTKQELVNVILSEINLDSRPMCNADAYSE
jgi:hypothetical protein